METQRARVLAMLWRGAAVLYGSTRWRTVANCKCRSRPSVHIHTCTPYTTQLRNSLITCPSAESDNYGICVVACVLYLRQRADGGLGGLCFMLYIWCVPGEGVYRACGGHTPVLGAGCGERVSAFGRKRVRARSFCMCIYNRVRNFITR